MGILNDMVMRDLAGNAKKEECLQINNSALFKEQYIKLLCRIAIKPFNIGGFQSLKSIIDKYDVNIEGRKGVFYCSVPQELMNLQEYWQKKLRKCREHNGDRQEISRRLEEIRSEVFFWEKMLKLGEYIPIEKKIVLYPEAMLQCDAEHFEQLLVSTFVHETMHAYFDREGHDMYPYVPFIEEPLAEFGMLRFLNETGHEFYDWTYNNVKNKKTCYRYGAALMDRHIKEGQTSTIRQFLEKYKVYVAERPMHPMVNVDGRDVVDVSSNDNNNVQPRVAVSNWQNVYDYPPRYFYDDGTKTLGLDGTWSCDQLLNKVYGIDIHLHIHTESERIDYVYLGEHFDCESPHDIDHIMSSGKLIISSENVKFKAINGIPILKSNNKPFLSRCGDDCYVVSRNGKWGAVDGNLNTIIPFIYDCIWSFDEYGFCMVRTNHKYGLVDKHGVEQIPVIYDDITHFRNGFATMRDDNERWGVIDCHGEIVVPCEYDDNVIFDKNGIAKVKKDGKEYRINTKGERV